VRKGAANMVRQAGNGQSDGSGILYLLTNSAMPNMVKIGITTKTTEERMSQLYSTGVPLPFTCEAAIEVPNVTTVETLIQQMFSAQRVNPKREFFYLGVPQAKALFSLLEQLRPAGETVKDVTNDVQEIINKNVDEKDRESVESFRRRRPKMRFEDMNIKVGSRILFVKDATIEATVLDGNKVKFQDEEGESLTSLTQRLLSLSYPVQPSPFWTYEGKALSEIYEETYVSE